MWSLTPISYPSPLVFVDRCLWFPHAVNFGIEPADYRRYYLCIITSLGLSFPLVFGLQRVEGSSTQQKRVSAIVTMEKKKADEVGEKNGKW